MLLAWLLEQVLRDPSLGFLPQISIIMDHISPVIPPSQRAFSLLIAGEVQVYLKTYQKKHILDSGPMIQRFIQKAQYVMLYYRELWLIRAVVNT